MMTRGLCLQFLSKNFMPVLTNKNRYEYLIRSNCSAVALLKFKITSIRYIQFNYILSFLSKFTMLLADVEMVLGK